MLTPAGLLVAWGNGVLRGACSPDAAAEVVERCGGAGPVFGGTVTALPALLSSWRDLGVTGLRLLQPVPGDPGLRLGSAADSAAMRTGSAAVVIGEGPVYVHHDAGPRRGWEQVATGVPVPAPPVQALPEAERVISAVVREATELLADLGTADADEVMLAELNRLRVLPSAPLPPGHPGPAVAALALTQRLRPMIELAAGSDPAITSASSVRRREQLANVADALRRAETAAIDAGVPVTIATTDRR